MLSLDSQKPIYTHHQKQNPHLFETSWTVEGSSW